MAQLWHKTEGWQNMISLGEKYGTVVKIWGPFNVRSRLADICFDLLNVGNRTPHLRPSRVAPRFNQRTADLRSRPRFYTVRMLDS
jgi:hypothetical protein